MSCFHPLKGYKSPIRNKDGKFSVQFKPAGAFTDLPVSIPCGKCLGCLLERARTWAVRCVHEASLYRENCFLTLTYSPENLPNGGSLNPRDFVLFMKKLRKRIGRMGKKIRFIQCGEYGEMLERPHHHVIIFGWSPEDKLLWKKEGNVRLYISPLLAEVWGKGHVTVGDVTYESANYVAKYVLKKVGGDAAKEHYKGKIPEYITMSRRPGLGRYWYDKYKDDVYRNDKLVYGLGKITKSPRFYDKIFEKEFPAEFEKIRKERVKTATSLGYNAPERVKIREKLAEARQKFTVRKIHVGGTE